MSISVNKSFLKKLGKHMQEVRKSKGLSQDDLAIKAETHRSLIADIENGNSNAKINTLNALADALGVNLPELLDYQDKVK